MEIHYATDERIHDILVNGHSVFNRDRSVAAHHRRMAGYQRAGIGLVYADHGRWVADHLHGAEKARVEARVNCAWAETHRRCPRSTQVIDNPKGSLTLYRCPECGQSVGLTAAGKILPHSVRVAP